MDDVSITFTGAELAKLRHWTGLLSADQADPTLVGKIIRAHKHSQEPEHPPELTAAETEPFWCMVRADSQDGRGEVQHWSGHTGAIRPDGLLSAVRGQP